VWEISPRRGPTGLLPCYWSRGVIGASSASQCFAATPLTPPEPPENIRTCFEGFRADVEALAEGNPEWDGVLQECRDLVEAVPPGPSGELQLAEVAAA
jgi:hypothetical protein